MSPLEAASRKKIIPSSTTSLIQKIPEAKDSRYTE
jgi:hypothetical protein